VAQERTKIYVGFGDIIYALILGSSFDFLKDNFVPLQLTFNTFTIFLAYATVVQSWIGYHKVLETHSYKNSFIFVIDLIIWFLFFMLIFNANNFDYYIKFYPFVFLFLMIRRYGVIRADFVREGWLKTIKALMVLIIYVVTSSITVIAQTMIETNLNKEDVLVLNSVTLGIMYLEIFLFYQLRKNDRISKVLKAKVEQGS